MSTDFSNLAILQQRSDAVEAPKPPPAGTYDGFITKFEFGTSKNKKTPYVRYYLKAVMPGPDVDIDQFTTYGGNAKLADAKLQVDYYITPDALFRLTEMHARIGLPSANTVQANIPEAVNKACKFKVSQRPSEDGKMFYAQVDEIMAP